MKEPIDKMFNDVMAEILSDTQGDNLNLLEKYAAEKGTKLIVDRSFEYLMFKTLGPSLMKGYESIPLVKPLPKVIFEILDDNELNASAIKTDQKNTYIVFVHNGLINNISSFIEELIDWEHNPEKARHENEKEWLKGLFHQLVVEHELSHIFNGHLDYLENMFQSYKIEENSKYNDTKEINFIKQTLEMDADCCALSRLYGWLNNLTKENVPKEINEMVSKEGRKLETSYSDLMMCFYVLNKFYFNLTELTEVKGQRGRSTPRERVMASFGNLILYLKTFKINVDVKNLLDEAKRKIYMVEDLFDDIYGTPKNKEMITNHNYLDHTELTREVLMNWENIQKELLKYNFIPIADQKRDLILGDWLEKELLKSKNK